MIIKKFVKFAFFIGFLFNIQVVTMPAHAQDNNLAATAQSITANLVKGDYVAITNFFDATMKSALSAQQLEGVWKQLQATGGSYKNAGNPEKKVIQGYDVIEFAVEFERAKLIQRTVFDKQGKVAGLFFLPG